MICKILDFGWELPWFSLPGLRRCRNYSATRKHSSRMHTIHFSLYGGVSLTETTPLDRDPWTETTPLTEKTLGRDPHGQRPPDRDPPGQSTPLAGTWDQRSPLWTEWHMLLKILPCHKLRLRAIKNESKLKRKKCQWLRLINTYELGSNAKVPPV